MRKFTENDFLMKFIAEGNIEELKKELLNSIFFLKGDRKELNNALEYINLHTDFTFDEHNGIWAKENSNFKSLYADEAINMEDNFSKERFDKLIDLYAVAYKEVVDDGLNTYESQMKRDGIYKLEENETLEVYEDEQKKKKYLLIGGGLLLGAILIYLIVD
ncbi:hypothetical protein ACYSNM_10785 [Myroides sp. LJL116]